MQMGLDFTLVAEVEELVAGVDEVGRGPLCGAVVTAAVILDPNRPILGLNGSPIRPRQPKACERFRWNPG